MGRLISELQDWRSWPERLGVLAPITTFKTVILLKNANYFMENGPEIDLGFCNNHQIGVFCRTYDVTTMQEIWQLILARVSIIPGRGNDR